MTSYPPPRRLTSVPCHRHLTNAQCQGIGALEDSRHTRPGRLPDDVTIPPLVAIVVHQDPHFIVLVANDLYACVPVPVNLVGMILANVFIFMLLHPLRNPLQHCRIPLSNVESNPNPIINLHIGIQILYTTFDSHTWHCPTGCWGRVGRSTGEYKCRLDCKSQICTTPPSPDKSSMQGSRDGSPTGHQNGVYSATGSYWSWHSQCCFGDPNGLLHYNGSNLGWSKTFGQGGSHYGTAHDSSTNGEVCLGHPWFIDRCHGSSSPLTFFTCHYNTHYLLQHTQQSQQPQVSLPMSTCSWDQSTSCRSWAWRRNRLRQLMASQLLRTVRQPRELGCPHSAPSHEVPGPCADPPEDGIPVLVSISIGNRVFGMTSMTSNSWSTNRIPAPVLPGKPLGNACVAHLRAAVHVGCS